jgi:hypothetical protein
MPRYRYLPPDTRLESRCEAVTGLLGAFLLAMFVFLPILLWWTGVLP